MLTKAMIKSVQALKDKKSRQEQGLFCVEGGKAVAELLDSKIKVKTLFATAAWLDKHGAMLTNRHETIQVAEKEMKQLSGLVTAREVLCTAFIPSYSLDIDQLRSTFSIVLEDVQDPGNLGTIIRVADWYGIGNVICSPACADVYNPKVLQATMGSFARVQVHYTSLPALMKEMSGTPVYGALMQGQNLYEASIKNNGLLIIGNEGGGISKEMLKFVTDPVTIPRRGKAESLNAGIATAVICDAWARNF